MIEVRLLGAQSVRDADGNEILSVSAQPKRLALLTYLLMVADSGDGFVSRDELLALFWPESDEEHARNTLNQHLYRLRASLGSDALVSHGANRVGVASRELWCDAAEFRRALETEQPERAMELYAGEFLPAFHVSGTPDLEKWLDNLRLDLQRRAVEAALKIGRSREGTGEARQAMEAYRRALELGPGNAEAEEGLARVAAAPVATAGSSGVASVGRGEPLAYATDRGLDRRTVPVGVALTATALVAGTWWINSGREQLPDPEPRVAILAIENLTGEPEHDHLIDVLHEELTRKTGDFGGILVVSRSSALAYRDSVLTLPEIGQRLEVGSLVEGSVGRSGDSLHVRFRVRDATSERSLWAKDYATALADSANLARRLPWTVANEVRRTLDSGAPLDLEPPRDPNPSALAAYLEGRKHAPYATEEDIEAAIELFDRGTELDPQFAEAWAALGRAWESAGGWFGHKSPVEAMPEAENAYERALALDSTLAEAHGGIATIEWRYRWRWDRAERAFRRSIELNPNLAETRDHYGNFLRAMSRIEEGVVQLEKAVELDPLGVWWAELRQHYQHLGRFEEARAAAERVKELYPNSFQTFFIYAIELWEDGEHLAAADFVANGGGHSFAAMFYAAAGRDDLAREQIQLEEASANRNPLFLAYAYMALHDTTSAVEWLETGIEERNADMVWLGIASNEDSEYEPMISDFPEIWFTGARFEAIMERLDFPAPSRRTEG